MLSIKFSRQQRLLLLSIFLTDVVAIIYSPAISCFFTNDAYKLMPLILTLATATTIFTALYLLKVAQKNAHKKGNKL
jgi:hypothetical protein